MYDLRIRIPAFKIIFCPLYRSQSGEVSPRRNKAEKGIAAFQKRLARNRGGACVSVGGYGKNHHAFIKFRTALSVRSIKFHPRKKPVFALGKRKNRFHFGRFAVGKPFRRKIQKAKRLKMIFVQ